MPKVCAIIAALMIGHGSVAVADPVFKPAGAELAAVTIAAASLKLSPTAQNIAPVRFDAAHGYEQSLANPTLTQLDVNGVPYVYMLIRVEREVEKGNRLILARIPADKFSDGNAITPFFQWETVPDSALNIKAPKGWSGVLNAAMAAHDGKILITYQANSRTKDSLGIMVLFDPVTHKTLWSKPIQQMPGYMGTTKPTGLTRVTAGPVAPTGDYFDSTKGRLVVGYMCRQDDAPACKGWDGFVLQELTFSGDKPQFQPPVRVLREEVPDGAKVSAWGRQGETVWKKQSFNFGNGGVDTLIFSVNFNMATENSPDHPAARDFPAHSKFFALSGLSALLDAAKSGPLDVSAKVPPSKTWVPDLSNDTPWDQGAMWNSMFYIDPFHANQKFVLYESWGAEFMQASQTRNALYGGSSSRTVHAGSADFSQSCDGLCGTSNVAGGGARKSYCLSSTAIAADTTLQGTEIAHDQPFDKVHDPVTGQGLQSAAVMCSDIGTSATLPGNLILASATVGRDGPALSAAEAICAAKGAQGVIWIDGKLGGKSRTNLPDTAALQKGDALTLACSTQYASGAFHRNVATQGADMTADMACAALGAGDGTGFRAYRSKLTNAPDQNTAIGPFVGLGLLAVQRASDGTTLATNSSTTIISSCGPGREMRGIASARVAP